VEAWTPFLLCSILACFHLLFLHVEVLSLYKDCIFALFGSLWIVHWC
jgi:hypothetical protein